MCNILFYFIFLFLGWRITRHEGRRTGPEWLGLSLNVSSLRPGICSSSSRCRRCVPFQRVSQTKRYFFSVFYFYFFCSFLIMIDVIETTFCCCCLLWTSNMCGSSQIMFLFAFLLQHCTGINVHNVLVYQSVWSISFLFHLVSEVVKYYFSCIYQERRNTTVSVNY